MRYMAIVKATADYEAGLPPKPELMAAMGKLTQDEAKSGRFVMGGGLLPSRQGHRFSMKDGKITIIDGPFTETKEVIGGFAILNYASQAEAIEATKDFLKIHADCGILDLDVEIRPMWEEPPCQVQGQG